MNVQLTLLIDSVLEVEHFKDADFSTLMRNFQKLDKKCNIF